MPHPGFVDHQSGGSPGPQTGGTCSALSYFLTDQLGSVVAVTDAGGALVSQQRYLPFGQVRTDAGSITLTDFGFTDQRNLDAQGSSFQFGLMDYHARFYDPSLGRFTQPDTLTPGGPQGLDRYSYTTNNPVNAIDPSGHFDCSNITDPYDKARCDNSNNGGFAGSTPNGGTSGNNGHNTTSINNLKIKSSGEIFINLDVMRDTDAANMDLSTHAEEGYSDFGGLPDLLFPLLWIKALNDLSTVEDFIPSQNPVYSINLSLSWQHDSLGLGLNDLTVRNSSPSIVGLNQVLINNPRQTIISGPSQMAYQGESIKMNLNQYVNSWFDASVEIDLRSYGGFPSSPYAIIEIPVGSTPFPGCSVLNFRP